MRHGNNGGLETCLFFFLPEPKVNLLRAKTPNDGEVRRLKKKKKKGSWKMDRLVNYLAVGGTGIPSRQ